MRESREGAGALSVNTFLLPAMIPVMLNRHDRK
jgi:hypothetical protein